MIKRLINRALTQNLGSNPSYINVIPQLEEYAFLTEQSLAQVKDMIVDQVAEFLEPTFGNQVQQLLDSQIRASLIRHHEPFESLTKQQLLPIVRELGPPFHNAMMTGIDRAIDMCGLIVEQHRLEAAEQASDLASSDSPTSSQLEALEADLEAQFASSEASSVESIDGELPSSSGAGQASQETNSPLAAELELPSSSSESGEGLKTGEIVSGSETRQSQQQLQTSENVVTPQLKSPLSVEPNKNTLFIANASFDVNILENNNYRVNVGVDAPVVFLFASRDRSVSAATSIKIKAFGNLSEIPLEKLSGPLTGGFVGRVKKTILGSDQPLVEGGIFVHKEWHQNSSGRTFTSGVEITASEQGIRAVANLGITDFQIARTLKQGMSQLGKPQNASRSPAASSPAASSPSFTSSGERESGTPLAWDSNESEVVFETSELLGKTSELLGKSNPTFIDEAGRQVSYILPSGPVACIVPPSIGAGYIGISLLVWGVSFSGLCSYLHTKFKKE